MDVAPSSPRRASLASPNCPHSRLPVPDLRFLTSDFQLPLAPALSTCDVSTFDSSTFLPSRSLSPLESMPMRRARKRKSSGLKLFGMSKCTARTQKNRPCKCLGMRALQSMRVSSPLESVFAKNLGVPLCVRRWKTRRRMEMRLQQAAGARPGSQRSARAAAAAPARARRPALLKQHTRRGRASLPCPHARE